jgi:MEKHLA domain
MEAPDESNQFLAGHAGLLIRSYRDWTGRDLVDPGLAFMEQARALHEAPFAVAAHGIEADPVFNYANRAALAVFEADWEAFTSMPSRLSAEPVERQERARLLTQVTARGFLDNYSGVRVSTTGRRFRIRRATVWNVIDPHGLRCGQAVMFHDWEYL